MALEQGTASFGMERRRGDQTILQFKRERAIRKANARLANLHPHEWKVLLEAALKEEGLTS